MSAPLTLRRVVRDDRFPETGSCIWERSDPLCPGDRRFAELAPMTGRSALGKVAVGLPLTSALDRPRILRPAESRSCI